MTRRRMTKKQAEDNFFSFFTPTDDIPRNKESWNMFTDNLNRGGDISERQRSNWDYPKKQKSKFLYSYEKKRKR